MRRQRVPLTSNQRLQPLSDLMQPASAIAAAGTLSGVIGDGAATADTGVARGSGCEPHQPPAALSDAPTALCSGTTLLLFLNTELGMLHGMYSCRYVGP